MDLHEMAVSYLNAPDQKKTLELAKSLYDGVKYFLRVTFADQVPESLMEDVLQVSLIAIFEDLEKFEGKTEPKFKAWCKGIFFYKKSDMWRKIYAHPLLCLPPDELQTAVDNSEQIRPFSPGEKPDLDDAMAIFEKLEPDCFKLLWKKAGGMKLREIAKEMNLNSDRIRMRIRRCAEKAFTWITKKKK
jgi:DNA-directed RNA polymerase specialized sigma24 family protein